MYTKNQTEKRLIISQFTVDYEHWQYNPCGRQSYYSKETITTFNDAYINLNKSPVLINGKEI